VSTGAATVAPVRAAIFRVNEKDRAWVDGLCTPQPLATLTQKLVLTGARERIAKELYIRAKGYQSPSFDAALAKVSAQPAWRAFSLDCGHDVMVDMPDPLAQILLTEAGGDARGVGRQRPTLPRAPSLSACATDYSET
jgi:hypothetical protein